MSSDQLDWSKRAGPRDRDPVASSSPANLQVPLEANLVG